VTEQFNTYIKTRHRKKRLSNTNPTKKECELRCFRRVL